MKGDRFEKMARKVAGKKSGLLWQEAASLLRKEHRAVVKMVAKQADECAHSGPHNDSGNCVGYRRACVDILAALDRRAKGG